MHYKEATMSLPKKVRLPELEALWKWPRQVNPHLSGVAKESLEWCASFNAFDVETQRLVHDKGKLSEFCPPYTYPSKVVPDVCHACHQISWQECAILG